MTPGYQRSDKPGVAETLISSADSRAQETFRVPTPDYRVIRFIPAGWTPLRIWGLDFFVWHIPLLKTALALDALIVWWLR